MAMDNYRYVDIESEVLRDNLKNIKAAAAGLVSAVERYVEPKPGDAFLHRNELLYIKNTVKELLKGRG